MPDGSGEHHPKQQGVGGLVHSSLLRLAVDESQCLQSQLAEVTFGPTDRAPVVVGSTMRSSENGRGRHGVGACPIRTYERERRIQ